MKKTLALLLLLAGLTVEAQGELLDWNGSEDFDDTMDWNEIAKNWLDQNGQAVSYQDGDWVYFRDSGSGKVMLREQLEPSQVLVDNSVGHDYTFACLGGQTGLVRLTGKMMLIKHGKGKLTIETSNDYTGDTIISEGTLVLGHANALGQSPVYLQGSSVTLDLGTHTLANAVIVTRPNATISNGTLEGRLTIDSTSFTWSDDSLILAGKVELNDNATLDLGMHTLSASVTLSGGFATIGNGTINGNLTVADNKNLALLEHTTVTGGVSLGAKSSLNLGGNTVTGAVTLSGSATIGNGTINGDLTVADNKSLALLEHTTVTGGVSLGAQSSLNLGGNTFHTGGEGGSQVTFSGDATVSNGTLVLDSDWSPGYALTFTDITLDLNKHTLSTAVSVLAGNSTTIANGTVKLLADLTGEGTIVFGEDTMVDMNGYTLSQAFSLAGDTTFTNGKVRLTDDVSGEGTFILGEGVTLDTNFRTISNKITLSGSTVTILGGNFDNDLTVGKGQTLIVTGTSMTGKGTLYLGDGATLRQKPTSISSYITNAVMVTGNATIDNGNLSSWVTVAPGVKLTVSGSLNMANSSSIALQDGAILDLGGGSDINARVYVGEDAFVGNGCVNKEIRVNSLSKLTLFDSLTCIDIGSQETSTGITLQNNAAVDLGGKTHIIDVRAYGNASIGNGTLDGSVTANHDSSLNFFGETRIKGGTQIPGGTQNPDKTATSGLVTVGNTTIKSLDNANPGLLKELSVSNGLIAGTDRCTSLADGLYIESTAALMIKNMTITANNELHAGYMLTNTVTLNQVTIDLSKANFKLVGSDYYFQVQSLINCTLDMDDVVFDASGLELPTGFDPALNGIGFDFGDDVFIGKTEATLLMGDRWSQTVSLGDRGQMVFTALVPTPEPATSTLSLLALAALAARRRRK